MAKCIHVYHGRPHIISAASGCYLRAIRQFPIRRYECVKIGGRWAPAAWRWSIMPGGANRPAWGSTTSQKNIMTSRAVLSVAVLAIIPALGFGAEDPKPSQAPQAQQNPDQQSAKIPGAVPVDAKTYIIGPEDVLLVLVWGQQELSCTCTVRSDGMITVPLINEIKAAGMTPLGLAQVITEGLSSQVLVHPQVTVSLQAAHSKKYFLSGQLRATGQRDLIMPTTVLEAIVGAGGFLDFANEKNITIVRGDKRLKFNYKEVIAGKNLKQNVYLESGDMIIVK